MATTTKKAADVLNSVVQAVASRRTATTITSAATNSIAPTSIDSFPPPKDDRLAIGLGVGISLIVLLLGAIIAFAVIRKRKAKIPSQSSAEGLMEPQGAFLESRNNNSLSPAPTVLLPKPPLSLLFFYDTDFGPSLFVTQQLEKTISSSLSSQYKVSTESVGIAGLPEEIEIARSELDRFDCILVAVHKVDRFLIYREGKIVHRLKGKEESVASV
ncbi:hypothetical protein BDR26DRAFT_184225 [Obelidium mucronatum]|nr:hypothetical protein BDR26DRAFT_184225 [Obelidium mucronatum]